MTAFASFLAGSIISLLMPVLLLIAIWVWYWFAAKRFGPAARDRREAQGAAGTEAPAGAGGTEAQPPSSA